MSLLTEFLKTLKTPSDPDIAREIGSIAVDSIASRMPILQDPSGTRYYGLLKYAQAQYFVSRILQPVATLCPVEPIRYYPKREGFDIFSKRTIRQCFASLDRSHIGKEPSAEERMALSLILAGVFHDKDSQVMYDYDQTGAFFFDKHSDFLELARDYRIPRLSPEALMIAREKLMQLQSIIRPDFLKDILSQINAVNPDDTLNLRAFRDWTPEACKSVEDLNGILQHRTSNILSEVQKRLELLKNQPAPAPN
jgi:hypothetical protein